MQLGVGLLEKGRPELLLGVGLHEDKLPIPCWKAVINDDINPLAILPELKVEDASIHLAEALVKVNHTVPQPLVHGQVGGGSQKPAVAQLSLVDVKPISSTLHKPGLPSKFPRSAPFQVVPTFAEEHGGLKGRG